MLDLLRRPDFDTAMEEILSFPPRRVVNPLFSFLYHGDPLIRWRAVTSLGAVTAALADKETESARIVFRRLLWNVNDESGGIGWGSPEVMGEIMFRRRKMRKEYLSILLSFLDPKQNFLEHEGLQQGVLWAAGRVAQAAPEAVRERAFLIEEFLSAENPALRGTAAWACGEMEDAAAADRLAGLLEDPNTFSLWAAHRLQSLSVGRAAESALEKIRHQRKL